MTTLFPGQKLLPGQSLQSNNRLHTFIMQPDGNAVLYDRNKKPLWATNTAGITPRDFIMQTDGNLVLYCTAGIPRWNSNTAGNPGAFFNIQDDGNLVVYRAGSKTETADNSLWAAGSNDRPPGTPQAGAPQGSIAEQILMLHNQLRAGAGVAPLVLNAVLMESAQKHSQDMADHNLYSHIGSDGSNPFERISRAGGNFSAAGESIYASPPTAEVAMAGWYNEVPPNDEHRKNILNPVFTQLGVGYAENANTALRYFWTADYAGN